MVPTDATSWSAAADWILPADAPPIPHAILRGQGAIIQAVGPADAIARAPRHLDLTGHVILPGLINAHTHLELSHLGGKLPRRATMPRWLLALMRHRGTADQLRQAVADGAAQALATGTTTLADISHDNSAWPVLAPLPLRKLCLAEILGRGPLEHGAIGRLAASLADIPDGAPGDPAASPDGRLWFGLSPHAPYSTSEAIYRHAIELARERNWPICTHLAETKGERLFLTHGRGAFANFMRQLGLLDDSFAAPACGPIDFARRVGLLDAAPILAHVNYLDDDELRMLADSPASVVYCPLSSEFFGRKGHRYAEMLDAGINVALGTDSLASNDSLDMLAEMRRLRRDARIDNGAILRMATLHGAIALRQADRIGSLTPGKAADWIAVELPASQASHASSPNAPRTPPCSDPLEIILTQPCKVSHVAIAGQPVQMTNS